MESDAQMADAELEQLLLEEPVASEQIASMKASIDRLVGTVQEMAQKTALQERASSARAATEVVIEQLNRQEFENVEYHATFDPIAAAQATKDERAAAEAEGRPPESTYATKQAPRILLGVDHPLHLRHRCQCALFNQMAHVALPSLTHPMARSKKVQDMFQLANVASISEQTCWGDERKEEELRKKNSSYITSYGLALAVDAHRRRCHPYAEAVEQARGKRFDHSAVFETPVLFDLGEHLTTAIAMLDRVRLPGAVANDQDIFLAVPQPFSRVHPDVDYPDNVVPFVYQDWSALAHKMISMPITTSIIVVWPDTTPESREMRQVLIALERHLQCGGALAFFPSPYEDENIKEWTHMGRVCAEFVKYMTAPERSFDAVVRDHYSDVLEQAPFTHPACCLGTRPRSGKALFSGRQILLFLQKLRLTVNDLIRLDEFDFASPELKDHRRREKMLRNKRSRDEHRPNFWVIQDPERRRRELPLTFKEPGRQRHYQPARKDRDAATSTSDSRHKPNKDYPRNDAPSKRMEPRKRHHSREK